MRKGLLSTVGAAAIASLTIAAIALPTPASAYDSSNLTDPTNPASPNNPSHPLSPLNPANQWSYGYGYGYGYGAANPSIVALAFWTGRPYSAWACQLGVDFQCPSSPNYAYRRPAAAAYDPANTAPSAKIRRKHRHRY